jgi:hypothetical protein
VPLSENTTVSNKHQLTTMTELPQDGTRRVTKGENWRAPVA